jgi:acyl carrier protein
VSRAAARAVVRDDVALRIDEIIVELMGVDSEELTPDTLFNDDLGFDSLDTVELAMALETAFGIEIDDEQAESLTMVGECVAFVKARLAERA